MKVIWAALVLMLTTGCQSGPEITEVSGKIVKGGKPLDEVHVEFLPDPEKGISGALSYADTAADGTFTLQLYGNDVKSGALVGWHRVTLQDFKSLNSRDRPIPPRFDASLGFAATTPIKQQVTAGMGPVVIDLDSINR